MTEMAVMKFRAKITERFTTTTREWLVAGRRWSVVGGRWLVVGGWWLVVSRISGSRNPDSDILIPLAPRQGERT